MCYLSTYKTWPFLVYNIFTIKSMFLFRLKILLLLVCGMCIYSMCLNHPWKKWRSSSFLVVSFFSSGCMLCTSVFCLFVLSCFVFDSNTIIIRYLIPLNIYLHEVNNRNTRKMCEICSMLNNEDTRMMCLYC